MSGRVRWRWLYRASGVMGVITALFHGLIALASLFVEVPSPAPYVQHMTTLIAYLVAADFFFNVADSAAPSRETP